ncbi:hypothetical protein [Lutibacter sp.]
MRNFKITISLLLMVTFFASCEKETILLQENTVLKTKDNLNARPETIGTPLEGLYALYPWDDEYDNIAMYNYNPSTDAISLNENFIGSTGNLNNFGFDFNYNDGLIYLLADNEDYSGRYLYIYDKNSNTSTLLAQIISVEGNNKPQDLTFGGDGTLYFVFQSGEINSYNVNTQTMSAFSEVPQKGAVGLTYNFDSNQLLYATSDSPVELYSISIATGSVEELFSFYTPGMGDYCTAQGIEYVGNNKVIVTSTYGCDIIYTVNLNTENTNLLLYPTGSYESIKDLMYINSDVDGDGILNEDDPYPYSNTSEFMNIDGCYPNVENVFVAPGITMMDQIDEIIDNINAQYNGTNWDELHREFSNQLAALTASWKADRLISRRQRSKIFRCVVGADIPSTIIH